MVPSLKAVVRTDLERVDLIGRMAKVPVDFLREQIDLAALFEILWSRRFTMRPHVKTQIFMSKDRLIIEIERLRKELNFILTDGGRLDWLDVRIRSTLQGKTLRMVVDDKLAIEDSTDIRR